MYDTHDEERKVEIGEVSLKEQVGERKATHDHASNGITSFAADLISQYRDPGTTQDRREGKGAHDNTYVCLGTAMILNEKGEEKECAQTADGKEVGSGHEEKCACVKHDRVRSSLFL
jgi:hypothetical protein